MGRNESGIPAKRTFRKRMVQTKRNQCKYILCYARLRKLRENVCRNIVSIEAKTPQLPKSEIKISSGEIRVTIPLDASASNHFAQLSPQVEALKTVFGSFCIKIKVLTPQESPVGGIIPR